MGPEVLHLVCTLIGVGLGWYIRHQSIGVPAEVLEALQQLFASKQKKDSQGLLQELLQALPPSPGPHS